MISRKKYLSCNKYMLKGSLKRKGYDWWWHSFTGYNKTTGEPKTFFIEYFIVNPSKSSKAVIFGQKDNTYIEKGIIKERKKPSYVMVKVGCWGENAKQIHNFYPTKDLIIKRKDFQVKIHNCFLSESRIVGSVVLTSHEAAIHPEYMSDSGSMSWNLMLDKQISYNPGYGTSWFFRKLNAFEMYWHAQGVKTQYTGTVFLDGVEYIVPGESSYGYADKNWGSDFTKTWLWLSSCNLVSNISGKRLNNSCFDIGGGCPKVFGVPLQRKLLVFFQHEENRYEFNFSHFWIKSKVNFNFTEADGLLHWSVTAEDRKNVLDVEIFCKKEESLLINYESPMGIKTFDKLWNSGNGYGSIKLFLKNKKAIELIEDARVNSCGCEYGEADI